MRSSLADFVDIHCHLLPGIDDGPGDMEQSLALAQYYVQTGVRVVIATPHFLPGTVWSASAVMVRALVNSIQKRLDDKGIGLQVLPGMEIAFHRKLEQRLQAKDVLSLADSGYYLIEPDFHGDQQKCAAALSQLARTGYRLILAHPERIEGFQRQPELLVSLAGQGILMQVNSGSLLGRFGRAAGEVCGMLQARGLVHFIASDAHDVARRAPLDVADWQKLQNTAGGLELLYSCCHNSVSLMGAGRILCDPQKTGT